jgi:AraC-like DNA-binding protein
MTVTEIMLETGYTSLGSFSTLFFRKTGYAPMEYRQTQRRKVFPLDLGYRFIPGCFINAFTLKKAGLEKP